MKRTDVIVIGGGAAGMMAAGRAGETGAKVLLLEKKDRLGSKLLISGKGRCNLTNAGDIDHFLENFGKSGQFLRNAFHRFFNQDLINFFEERGLKLKEERGGRIFPVTDKAKSIVDVLKEYLEEGRVEICYNRQVDDIMIKDKEVYGVRCKGGEVFHANKVILATGGLSYPLTGSTGDGYRIAKMSGHAILPLKPALVPLETKESWSRRLPGVALKNVRINVYGGTSQFGEMLWTHTGISGPIVLSLSAEVIDLLGKHKEVVVSIDLKPALSMEQLENRFLREVRE
ncbi:MAG: aminoacetone oxidase family FAD-binding enzyme, partial [Candidatus Omnitrophica bacterium]|nr:aminoacetone oxidase family FAD-binding enzyme [Candidatus Omnitrophota bacterium]